MRSPSVALIANVRPKTSSDHDRACGSSCCSCRCLSAQSRRYSPIVWSCRAKRWGSSYSLAHGSNDFHLEPTQVEALSTIGLDNAQLRSLSLSASRESTTRKIAARKSAVHDFPNLPRVSDLVLVHSSAWLADSNGEMNAADSASAPGHLRRRRIRYGHSSEGRASALAADPYGFVSKSGRWHLIGGDQGSGSVIAPVALTGCDACLAPACAMSPRHKANGARLSPASPTSSQCDSCSNSIRRSYRETGTRGSP